MATLEPQNVHVEIDLKHPDAEYGEVVAGRLHCSVRLLHGARVGKIIRGAESIYGRPHPAYHRGMGGTHKDDFFLNRQLTVPADLAAEPSKKAECTMPILSEGEITPDGLTLAQFLCGKPSDLAEKDISIMLLWPFKFQGDDLLALDCSGQTLRGMSTRGSGEWNTLSHTRNVGHGLNRMRHLRIL